MRTDKRIETAFLDYGDVRPLLLASSERELAQLREALGWQAARLDAGALAALIEARIDAGLAGADGPLLFRLASWSALRLGAMAAPPSLDAADAEIMRRAPDSPRLSAGGDANLLRLALAIARLRQKKMRRLRFWQPLIDRLAGRETAPVHKPRPAAPPVKDSTRGPAAHEDDALWETIKGAAGRLPLSLWEEKLKETREDIGRFNIIVAGRTGVGKTTLIGAIFGRDVGDTLMGRPRTRGRIWYPEHPGETDILRLCDTEGLEMERYAETLDGLKREIESRNGSHDPFDHIHVAWLCIDEPSLTVQPGEEALVKLLGEAGVPVIAVLTKAGMAPAFKAKVEELLPGVRAVIRVRASPIEIEGQTFAEMGLDELMQATQAIIPSAVEGAWHLASRNLAAMTQRAEQTVRRAAAAAGAAGATPIPIADAAGVFGVQAGMIIAVSLQMGVKLRRSDLQAMAVTLLGALGLTAGGRFIAGFFAKLIPGLGSIAGSALTGTAAAALTYGLGRAYIEYLRTFHAQHHRMPDADELVSGFHIFWDRWKNKEETPPPAPTS